MAPHQQAGDMIAVDPGVGLLILPLASEWASTPGTEVKDRGLKRDAATRGIVNPLAEGGDLSEADYPSGGSSSSPLKHKKSAQRMLDPSCYRCSSRPPSNHSPLVVSGLKKARFCAILPVGLGF